MLEVLHGRSRRALDLPEVHGHPAGPERGRIHPNDEPYPPIVTVDAVTHVDPRQAMRGRETGLGGEQEVSHKGSQQSAVSGPDLPAGHTLS